MFWGDPNVFETDNLVYSRPSNDNTTIKVDKWLVICFYHLFTDSYTQRSEDRYYPSYYADNYEQRRSNIDPYATISPAERLRGRLPSDTQWNDGLIDLLLYILYNILQRIVYEEHNRYHYISKFCSFLQYCWILSAFWLVFLNKRITQCSGLPPVLKNFVTKVEKWGHMYFMDTFSVHIWYFLVIHEIKFVILQISVYSEVPLIIPPMIQWTRLINENFWKKMWS